MAVYVHKSRTTMAIQISIKSQRTTLHHRYQVIHESLAPVELAWDPLSGLGQPIWCTSKVDVGFLLSPIFEYLVPINTVLNTATF